MHNLLRHHAQKRGIGPPISREMQLRPPNGRPLVHARHVRDKACICSNKEKQLELISSDVYMENVAILTATRQTLFHKQTRIAWA